MNHDKLRELAEAAKADKWVTVPGVTDDYRGVVAQWHDDDEWITDDGVATLYAEYIAAANPAVVLALLDEIAELRQGRGRYKEGQ